MKLLWVRAGRIFRGRITVRLLCLSDHPGALRIQREDRSPKLAAKIAEGTETNIFASVLSVFSVAKYPLAYSSVTQPSEAFLTFLMYLYSVPRVAL